MSGSHLPQLSYGVAAPRRFSRVAVASLVTSILTSPVFLWPAAGYLAAQSHDRIDTYVLLAFAIPLLPLFAAALGRFAQRRLDRIDPRGESVRGDRLAIAAFGIAIASFAASAVAAVAVFALSQVPTG